MKELLLIRHGESQYNAFLTDNLNSELTKEGINQARLTGKFLKKEFPNIKDFKGVTSPYLRCLQTSLIIKEETGIDFLVNSGPREVMMKYNECVIKNQKEEYPDFIWNHEDDLTFNKEMEVDFFRRMYDFYQYADSFHGQVLVVSHGTPINAIFEIATSPGRIFNAKLTDFVKNCSISYVKNNKEVWLGKTIYND